jgi:outer membrane protein assembly factor BamB
VPGLRVRHLVIVCLLAVAGCDGSDDRAVDSSRSAPSDAVQRFRSAPALKPPAVTVRRRAAGMAPGHVFLAPRKGAGQQGPMIIDDRGELVWFRPVPGAESASDFRVQSFRGAPVLTYWQGRFAGGGGNGEYVILDSAYREVARVRSVGDHGDLHEFELTPEGTALFFVYRTERGIVDCVIQEVDVATGRLLFQWSARDHVPLRDSYKERVPGEAWDYIHLNSIDVEEDGNLLVSARNTHAIYEIDRRTGRILWTLGGKASDFRMARGAQFAWAHDANRQPDGTITIFDNGAAPQVHEQSRGLVLAVKGRRVTVRRAYTHRPELLTHISAGMQRLPNGNVFIGWGATAYFSEQAPSGRLLFDARFTDTENDTYRAYRFPWTGRPAGAPKLAAAGATVYASWNGATEVRSWRVLAGPTPNALAPAGTAARRGFETAITVGGEPFVAVEAIGAGGEVLGRSRAIRR